MAEHHVSNAIKAGLASALEIGCSGLKAHRHHPASASLSLLHSIPKCLDDLNRVVVHVLCLSIIIHKRFQHKPRTVSNMNREPSILHRQPLDPKHHLATLPQELLITSSAACAVGTGWPRLSNGTQIRHKTIELFSDPWLRYVERIYFTFPWQTVNYFDRFRSR